MFDVVKKPVEGAQKEGLWGFATGSVLNSTESVLMSGKRSLGLLHYKGIAGLACRRLDQRSRGKHCEARCRLWHRHW